MKEVLNGRNEFNNERSKVLAATMLRGHPKYIFPTLLIPVTEAPFSLESVGTYQHFSISECRCL